MTKRRIETDLSELSEELLGDLTPSERLRLVLIARAAGRDDWSGQLHETCPRTRYEQPEMAFTARKWFAFMLGNQAVYDLRTTAMWFGWTETLGEINMILTLETDLDSAEYGFEPQPERARATWFRMLYVSYEGYTRFADAELDVMLEEWLAVHPDGPTTVAHVEAILDSNAGLREVAEAGDADGDDEEVSLDDVANQRAEKLQDEWDEVVSKIE